MACSQQRLLCVVGRLHLARGRRLLRLLVVQARRDLNCVPLVIQLEQPIEQLVLRLEDSP